MDECKFSGEKGTPVDGAESPSLLHAVSLPALAVYDAALSHNLTWMQRFATVHHTQLAPHGKTTMTPAIFRRQIDAGAWGITLATAPQCRAAYREGGVRRLLMANQLVDQANMQIIADLLRDPEVDFYCLVDSPKQAHDLNKFFGTRGLVLQVLIELGAPGGRCGCRSPEEVQALAREVIDAPALALAGIEGYEGAIGTGASENAIRQYVELLVSTGLQLPSDPAFTGTKRVITAAGSEWYDVVAQVFDRPEVHERFIPLLRPGCYVTHDHGTYAQAQQAVQARRPDLGDGLKPAMAVIAAIQSVPERGFAIAALGRRDVGFDAALPLPLRRYRASAGFVPEPIDGCSVTRLMDQHAFLNTPGSCDLDVGDIVAFGISHPCTTFDKWRQICLIDDEMNVLDILPTRF
ncbi:MAG TPA: amino acid deaminase [Gammaproteobacteria bacterium]|nr:amino acid deaminase [Gammaproteobacteria bacterium]